jgi:hypothetical protein
MAKKRTRSLKGPPSKHAEIADSYLSTMSDSFELFDKSMEDGNCGRALDWLTDAEASIQAVAVSATHSGRKEKAIRKRLKPLESSTRSMRTYFRRRCVRKKPIQ